MGGSLGAKNLRFLCLCVGLLLRRGWSEVLIKYTGNVWLQKRSLSSFLSLLKIARLWGNEISPSPGAWGLWGAPKWCFDDFFKNRFIAFPASLDSIFHVPDDNINKTMLYYG